MALVQARYGLPLLYLGLSGVAFALSLHTRNQLQRLALLPLILITAFLSLSTAQYIPLPPEIPLVWGQGLIGYALHTISILHIERLSPPVSGEPDLARLYMGFDLGYFNRIWLNPRLIRTHKIDSISAEQGTKQSRGVFVILQCSKILIYYIIEAKISPAIFNEIIIDILPDDVSPYQQSLLRPLDGFTAREYLTVICITFSTFWKTFVYLDGTNALMATSAVMIGIHDPEDWPPLFGPLCQAVGLRRFWSKFWHSLPTKPYKSIGEFISLRLLRFSQHSFAHKLTIALVAFGISGVAHAFIDWQRGGKFWHLNVYWFLLNFLGCLGESVFLKTLNHLAQSTHRGHILRGLRESWLGNFVGYGWVCFFFCWTVPLWRFPGIYHQSLEFDQLRRLLSKMEMA